MKTISPKQIKDVLTLTKKIREAGGTYIPCFGGDAGIGKSEVVQAWCKAQGPDFVFIDLRLAYMEGPDLIGMPDTVMVNGEHVTIHALPDFLPRNGQGMILFEEPNRANESTMNAMMQILTDRKIHKYNLPEGFIIAAAINPEGHYTVNSLDPALKNRFAMFDVVYDHKSFVDYIKESKWDSRLTAFIDKHWVYKSMDQLPAGAKYVSPRSLKQVNALLEAGAENTVIFGETLSASMGEIASDFMKMLREIKPLLLNDFLEDEKGSLVKLKKMAESPEYQGDLMSMTVSSISDAFAEKKINTALVFKIAKALTVDQGCNLIINVSGQVPKEEWDNFKQEGAEMFKSMERRNSGKI